MELVPLAPGDLQPSTPLPWRIFDAAGRLVLREGHCFEREEQIEQLLARDLYRAPTDAETARAAQSADRGPRDPFVTLEAATQTLKGGLNALLAETRDPAEAWVLPLVEQVFALNRMHADAVLGGLLLMDDLPYSLAHPWMCATLCDLMTRRLERDEGFRRSLVAAALTSNAGMFDVQDELTHQSAPLTDEQRKRVRQHPVRSAQLLAQAGVRDQVWLRIALSHHERLDGSGYPRKLAGDEIVSGARLLALADVYSAMLLPRAYRDGVHAKAALREIFTQRGGQIDADLAALFIKEIGVYPPGIFVRLENGETGVVTRRNPLHANQPIVSALWNVIGRPLERPIVRDTSEAKAFAVAEILPKRVPPMPLRVVWGYTPR